MPVSAMNLRSFRAAPGDVGPSIAPAGRRRGADLRIGILTNPRSGGNRRRRPRFDRLLAGAVLHRETASRQELPGILADFAGRGVNLLVVNGGDGTVQAVLSEIGGVFPAPPVLALLRAGTASMLARDVGLRGEPADALRRLLAGASHLQVVERPVLRVQRPGQPDLGGMFFGVGAICRGIELCHARFGSGAWRGEALPALILARLLFAFLRRDRTLLPPTPLEVTIDGGEPAERPVLFALVTTLDRVILGLHPGWGREAAPLHYTLVEAAPACVLRALPRLLRGAGSKPLGCAGCRSRNVQTIRLRGSGQFTLDGELFPFPAGGELAIRSAGPLSFLIG